MKNKYPDEYYIEQLLKVILPKTPPISLAHPIVNLYHGICTGLPKVVKMTDKRKAQLRARMRDHPDLEWWEEYFNRIAESIFLNGENDRNWRADFEFVTSDSGMTKILEGKFEGVAVREKTTREIIAEEAEKM